MVKTFIVHNFLSVAERYEMSNIKYWKKETLTRIVFFQNEPFRRNENYHFSVLRIKRFFDLINRFFLSFCRKCRKRRNIFSFVTQQMVHFSWIDALELLLVSHVFRGHVPQPMVPRPFFDQVPSVQSSSFLIRLFRILGHFRHEMTSTSAEYHLRSIMSH